MKNKLNKRFFETHKVPELSAANIFYFSTNDALPDLFQQFDIMAKEKGIMVPDNSNERKIIASMTDPESIVNYMRKLNTIENRHEMVEKVSEYAVATMPLIMKGINDECDFLYEEYERMRSAYPKESYSDFPLLALHVIKNYI